MATRPQPIPLYLLFLVARLILLVGLPLEGVRGYGDLAHFYELAGLGLPFFDYWVEFPPLFPFLSTLIYRVVGGSEHAYVYLLVTALSLAQAGGLALFQRLAGKLWGLEAGKRRSWAYFALLVCLPYGWWSFDTLAVFSMLLGLVWILEGKDRRAGLALGFGMLTKWFPGLGLLLAWRLGGLRRTWLPALLAVALVLSIYLGLYLLTPENTLASLRSQPGKGSWETIWALIDGNLETGNFGRLSDPLDPGTAALSSRNPARIPAWITLPFFAGMGLWLSRSTNSRNERGAVAFLGLAWCMFLFWMPGYSPQWVLYLLPLILLALPERQGILAGIALVLVNLLEWPVLLSRGLVWSLWLTVPLRTGLLLLVGFLFWQSIRDPQSIVQTDLEVHEDAWARA